MRMRSIAVSALAKGLQTIPFRPLMRHLFRRSIVVIFYHGVWIPGSGDRRRFGGVELASLRSDLDLLSRYFRFVGLEEAIAIGARGQPADEPVLAMTFDDGHEMLRSGAMDLLAEYGISATMFVVGRCIGNAHLMWMHKLIAVLDRHGADRLVSAYNQVIERAGVSNVIGSIGGLPWSAKDWPTRLREQLAQDIYDACDMPPVAEYLAEHRPYMSWRDIDAWRGRGHGIGFHTDTHPFCSMLGRSEIEDELVAPAWQLRRRLSLPSVPFAYPFGDRIASSEVERAVALRAGFSCMLGVDGLSPMRTSPFALERIDAEGGLNLHLFAKPLRAAVMEALPRRQAGGAAIPAMRSLRPQAAFR